jgi:NAD(P)-dependent dehydrogenase (short-subunit alcohol dehydrogenase family)
LAPAGATGPIGAFAMSHSPRVAIVTGGAGSGIGGGVSRTLANAGWHVLVVDIDTVAAEALVAEVDSRDKCISFLHCDLSDNDAPSRVVEAALAWRGRIDGLVNNVGIGCIARAADTTDEQFDRTFAVNVRAGFRLTRDVTKVLTQPHGTIVNVASVHGRQTQPLYSTYAATKGAVEAMTRGWAVDFGPAGIRVNCVLPGMVDCAQTRRLIALQAENVEGYLEKWVETRQLLPRLVANTDVGELVEFLLGPKSQGITGQSIVIDAGTSLMLTDRG